MTTGVHVDVILTASSHVRTEPQSVIGHTRGKKRSFQSIPLLINSINLKRDGVGICLEKDVGR